MCYYKYVRRHTQACHSNLNEYEINTNVSVKHFLLAQLFEVIPIGRKQLTFNIFVNSNISISLI